MVYIDPSYAFEEEKDISNSNELSNNFTCNSLENSDSINNSNSLYVYLSELDKLHRIFKPIEQHSKCFLSHICFISKQV